MQLMALVQYLAIRHSNSIWNSIVNIVKQFRFRRILDRYLDSYSYKCSSTMEYHCYSGTNYWSAIERHCNGRDNVSKYLSYHLDDYCYSSINTIWTTLVTVAQTIWTIIVTTITTIVTTLGTILSAIWTE